MKKAISQFRTEPYGFFIDLAGESGRTGIDLQTGNIFLDEGEGPDRFHGAVIEPKDFVDLELRHTEGRVGGQVILHFGEHQTHPLGTTEDVETAREWVKAVSSAIRASDGSALAGLSAVVAETAPGMQSRIG